MRIAIIGYSGSGKSTLARSLGQRYGCPVLHMDVLHFRANWQERQDDKARYILEKYIDNPDWVIDGNYGGLCFEDRMSEAQHILFLDLPRRTCLMQAWNRYKQHRGRTRSSMAPGCPEKFDLPFLWWILWKGRGGKYKKRYRSVCREYPDKVIHCKSRADVTRLLETGLEAWTLRAKRRFTLPL